MERDLDGRSVEPIVEICACFALRKTARAVTQYYDAMLKPCGLRTTQYSLLMNVAREEPVSVSRLAESMGIDQTTVTRNVRILVLQGLLAGAPGRDRRRRLLSLTDAGHDALDRAQPLWHAAQSAFVENIGDDGWSSLLGRLKAARDATSAAAK